MMRVLALAALLTPLAVAGCSDGDEVREFKIHIGWNADGTTQYMEPSEIRVRQGDKVRFVVINDDDPNTDYNGAGSGKDNFHDVAIDYPGACNRNPIEHEAPAGQPPAVTECTFDGVSHDYFVADAKGTFEILCEVKTSPTHAARGMRADFIVE